MALQKDYNFKGVLLPNAYHKIVGVHYRKEPEFTDMDGVLHPATYWLNICTEISATKGSAVIDNQGYNMQLDITVNRSYTIMVYEYLLSLPEFAGALSV